MADKYATEVIGCDIAATQPNLVPPNCFFEIEDAEADWVYPEGHFNFVHCRDMMTAIRDWGRLISQAKSALLPGGWIQLSSTVRMNGTGHGSDVEAYMNATDPRTGFR